MALTDKLSAIGDAIRSKTGKTDLLTLDQMPTEINSISGGGSDLPEEALTISGECNYRFYKGGWDWFIREYGNKITTSNITYGTYMFSNSTVEEIPFELNFYDYSDYANGNISIGNMFSDARYLKEYPKFNNCQVGNREYLFSGCYRLRTIPEDFVNGFNWSYIDSRTGSYDATAGNMFSSCYSLRSLPMEFLAHQNPVIGYYNTYFNYGFNNCCSLDELVGLPIPYTATYTSNIFKNTVYGCYRLKNMTFALDPETNAPYVKNWKSQTINLADYIGYCTGDSNIISFNSGITSGKRVSDDASYQALKDDPDWYAVDIAYSRYNHDSAVATINSLPDTSAYLASAGGTNTIMFRGAAGEKTDGGAINTLTEEEIAVATAKGWTVSLV